MLDLLLPTVCPACGQRGSAPCERCWRRLKPAPPVAPPAGVDAFRALLLYDGHARELLARLKYRNARSVLGWLIEAMAALVAPIAGAAVATWAPTSRARRRERGFDQAELLARGVARELRLPAARLLLRPSGPPQTGRPARERSTGVAFEIAGRHLPPAKVLVVDDVMTTGATLAAAAAALRVGGTREVVAVTAGRTPLKLANRAADV